MLKKFFNVFLGLLMTLTMIGVNPTPVNAEDGATLTGVYSFARYFTQESMNPFTNGGYSVAAVLKDSSGKVIGDLFCIEPGVHTGVGANYTNTYEQMDSGVAGVIYAFHMAMLDDSSNARAKYLGAQLAVWAKIRGNRGAIDGLVPTAEYQADASAAKYWAGVFYDSSDSAVAAVNTAWSNPYELSTGDFGFNASSTAVRFTTTGNNTAYFRSEPIHLDIQGDASKVAKVLSLVTYTVSLENAPAGTKITDINGNDRDTFVPAQSFRLYVPVQASVNHSPMKVNVRINDGYTAWTTEKWHSATNQDFAVQKAVQVGGKNKSFNVTFPTAQGQVPKKQILSNSLRLVKVAPQMDAGVRQSDGTTSIEWSDHPLNLAKFKATNVNAFTDTAGRHYDAESYIQYVYSDFHSTSYGNISFLELPVAEDGSDVKWKVTEEEAPKGYKKSQKQVSVTVKSHKCSAAAIGVLPGCEKEGDFLPSSVTAVTDEQYWFIDTPEYASFEFKKVNEENEPMSGVKFNLYNSEDIELYDGTRIAAGTLLGVLTSDANGNVSSSQLSFELPSTVNYYVNEVEAPANYIPELSALFIRKGSDSKYHVYDKENNEITKLVNRKEPTYSIVSTTATSNGEKTVTAGSEVTIKDKVVIKVDGTSSLEPGKTLRLVASFVDKNGTPVGTGVNVDFDPANFPLNDGKIEVETSLSINSAGLVGRYVVFEKLFDGTKLLSEHTDLNDNAQAITFVEPLTPAISTSAAFSNGSKTIVESGEATIIDTVTYSDLTAGETYTLKGYLVTANGSQTSVSGEKTFTPSAKNGTVNVEFTVNTDNFAGQKLTVFETLYKGSDVVAEHKELNDTAQTIEITEKPLVPSISTTAAFGDQKEIVAGGTMTLTDVVSYRNLVAGKQYTLKATYYNPGTGEKYAFEGSASFTAQSAGGTANVEVNINTDDYAGKSIVVYEELLDGDEVIASHKELTDAAQTVTITEKPKPVAISTTAKFANGEKEVVANGEMSLVDTVTYSGLVPGEEYRLEAEYYDAKTKEKIASLSGSKTFTPDEAGGTVDVTVTVNTDDFVGKSIVVVETLKKNEEKVAEHYDLIDEQQTVTIIERPASPEISTMAAFGDQKTVVAGGQMTLSDVVSYKSLEKGKQYTLKATYYNPETNEKYAFEGEASFTAQDADGHTNVDVIINTDDYAGKSIVVFEELFDGNEVIASHKELTDKNQTVSIDEKPLTPFISTSAAFGDQKEVVAGGTMTLTDVVSYRNLVAGKQYTLKATYYNPGTGEKYAFEGSASFTAQSADGTANVEVDINTDDYAGKSIVVYEELLDGDEVIASHKELTDAAQTVTINEKPLIPSISTTAAFGDQKEIVAGGTMTLTDVVSYRNLVAGKQYTLKATYYNPETGEKYAFEGSANFTAETADGTANVEVSINTDDYAGKSIVVYEELLDGDEVVASHKELTDKDQTVKITEKPAAPEIATSAVFGTQKEIVANGRMTLTDIVSYKNLTKGKQYVLRASYYNPETRGKYPFTGSASFVADAADGQVNVNVIINTDDYAGKSIVVFEELLADDKVIASHKAFTDEKQTVRITEPVTPEISTVATFPDDAKEVEPEGTLTLTDTVTYSGLTIHKEYRLKATYYDPATGEKYDFEGEKVFTAGEAKGHIDVLVDVPVDEYAGRSIVVYEELYDGNNLIASHKELTDKKQTVTIKENPPVPPVVSIATLAKFNDGTKEHLPGGTLTIIDTVSYTGLEEGKTYTLKAALYDQKTLELASVASKTFIARSVNGSEDVSINVISENFAGRSLVVYEELYLDDELIADHKERTDRTQIVDILEIPETYTLKIKKNLRGAFTGEPSKIGIDLSKDPLTFELSKQGSDEVITVNKENFKDGYYVVEGLSEGKYTLKEVTGMAETKVYQGFVYKIGKNEKEVSIILNSDKEVGFSNDVEDITEGSIRIEKTDEKTGARLEGVEFALYKDGDEKPIATGTTNYNGILEFKNLRHGKYVVQETKAKEGYYYNGTKYNIDMSKTVQDTVMKISLKNSQEGAKIKLIKTDSSVREQPVAGATYGVFKEGDPNPLETGITDKDGVIQFTKRFPDGDGIYIKEIKAAPGYRLDEKKHPVTIVGKKQELYVVKVTDAPYRLSLHLTKIDSDDDDIKLAGAVYALYYASDSARSNPIVKLQTNADGMIKINGLKRGKYVLVEEKAPDGYVIAESEKELEFDLSDKDDNEVITITAKNTKENKAVTIKTTATINGKKEVAWAEDLSITDRVCYTNLEIGKTYNMNASLHKKDGSTFAGLMKSGAKEFSPVTADGCVDVEIPLKTSAMKKSENYDIVVYESLTMKGKSGVIASHEEKLDEDQTVRVIGPSATPTPTPSATPTPSSTPTPTSTPAPGRDVKTGVEGNNILLHSAVMAVCAAFLVGLLEKRRKH